MNETWFFFFFNYTSELYTGILLLINAEYVIIHCTFKKVTGSEEERRLLGLGLINRFCLMSWFVIWELEIADMPNAETYIK